MHLHNGSINVHAQFCDSVIVTPFVVMNFEYEHEPHEAFFGKRPPQEPPVIGALIGHQLPSWVCVSSTSKSVGTTMEELIKEDDDPGTEVVVSSRLPLE